MRKKFISVSAAAAALVGGLVVPQVASTAAVPAATRSSISWSSCGDLVPGAECGFVTVPLDYAQPTGPTIKIAVSRVKHTAPASKYQGAILVNPGGPGGSGLGLSTLGQYVPHGVGDDYDWIGFDPRGVGSSVPSLHCDASYPGYTRPLYLPVEESDLLAWKAKSQAYAQACGADQLALLKNDKTVDSAKDMDRIRAALGMAQISYYGFSYGTYLGSVYATLFPTHLRRAVFDSTVDPTRVWYAANLDQDVAFDRNIKIWFGWLAKYNSVYHLGATEKAVEVLFYKTAVSLRSHPAGGKVGFDEWIDVFLYAGYYQLTWLDEAALFAGFINHHDVADLVDAYTSDSGIGDDNGYAGYLAVQCTDTQWPQSWTKIIADNWRVNARSPYETWSNAWFNGPCSYWPAPAGTPVSVNGSYVSSLLMIDETLDAATPYSGSLKVRSLFPNASLIALPGGTSHAVTLFGNACEDDLIADYLATGARPARVAGIGPDTTCAPLPQPVPNGGSTAAKAAVALHRDVARLRAVRP